MRFSELFRNAASVRAGRKGLRGRYFDVKKPRRRLKVNVTPRERRGARAESGWREKVRLISQSLCGKDKFPGDIVHKIRNEVDGRKAAEAEVEKLEEDYRWYREQAAGEILRLTDQRDSWHHQFCMASEERADIASDDSKLATEIVKLRGRLNGNREATRDFIRGIRKIFEPIEKYYADECGPSFLLMLRAAVKDIGALEARKIGGCGKLLHGATVHGILTEYKAKCWQGRGEAQAEGRRQINGAIQYVSDLERRVDEKKKTCGGTGTITRLINGYDYSRSGGRGFLKLQEKEISCPGCCDCQQASDEKGGD